MPSPFPGMDPYLEEPGMWADVHTTLTLTIRAELRKRIPPRYSVLADRYVWVRDEEAQSQGVLGKPDAIVSSPPPAPPSGPTTVLTAPATVVLPKLSTEKGNAYLQIIDRERRRVVTVLELLSPSNKNPGPDREATLFKRKAYQAARVNVVEIDLLRAGPRLPLGDPPPAVTDYYVLVWQGTSLPQAGLWAFSVREPLPEVQIPLNPEDSSIGLPLKPCLDRAYDDARFDLEIDYDRPPTPPLAEPDATWARELLANRARPVVS